MRQRQRAVRFACLAVKTQRAVQRALEIPLPSEAASPQLLHRRVSCGFYEQSSENAAGHIDTCNWKSVERIFVKFNAERFNKPNGHVQILVRMGQKRRKTRLKNYVPFWVQLDCDLLRHGELTGKAWNYTCGDNKACFVQCKYFH